MRPLLREPIERTPEPMRAEVKDHPVRASAQILDLFQFLLLTPTSTLGYKSNEMSVGLLLPLQDLDQERDRKTFACSQKISSLGVVAVRPPLGPVSGSESHHPRSPFLLTLQENQLMSTVRKIPTGVLVDGETASPSRLPKHVLQKSLITGL
jgi:hypothetical protein